MKQYRVIAATTDTDRAGEALAPESLRRMAVELEGKIMPFLVEHDFRRLVGRSFGARIEERADGHLQLLKTVEVFEPTDSLDAIAMRSGEYVGLTDGVVRVVANRAISDDRFQELVSGIEYDLGCQDRGRDLRQKTALTPLELIVILGGFVVVQSAGGFFKEAGAQAFRAIASRIKRYFEKGGATGLYFNLVVLCTEGGYNYEARVYVDAQHAASDAEAIIKLQPALAVLLPTVHAKQNKIVRVVLEFGSNGLKLIQRVREDGVPLDLRSLPVVPEGAGVSVGFTMAKPGKGG